MPSESIDTQLDWRALIEAATEEVHRATCGCDKSLHSRDDYDCLYRVRAAAALAGALPLITHDIEALVQEPGRRDGDDALSTHDAAILDAAARVRSYVEGSR